MAQIGTKDVLRQVFRIGQVAIMGQGNAVGGVNIERLRFCRTGTSGGRVTHMTDTHVANQPTHVAGAEHISHHTVILAQIEPVAVTGHDTCRVLPAMLQNGQRIINALIHIAMADNAHNAAHGFFLSSGVAR